MPDQPASGDWDWDLPPESTPPPGRGRRALDPADDFRRTVIFTIAGTAVPGLGLIAAKRRIVGSVILGIFAAAVLVPRHLCLVDRQGLLGYALNPTVLRRVGGGADRHRAWSGSASWSPATSACAARVRRPSG